MKKKIIKKSIAIVLLLITLFSILQNVVVAATEINHADVKSGEDCGLHLQYWYNNKWTYVITHYQYYTYDRC